jgi:hypothetical protein
MLPVITLYWFATILCIATELTFAAEISRGRSLQTDAPDLEFITSLRQEEFEHGKVMDIMSHLTDEIGPRLTGSPRMKKANQWTRDQLAKWGLANAHLEPYGPFGQGWSYQLCEVRMISPDYMQFVALPEAWTPGTNGPIRGEVTRVIVSSPADLEKYRGKLAGKIVLLGDTRIPDPLDKPMFTRQTESDLTKQAIYDIPHPEDEAARQENIKQHRFQHELNRFWADEHVAAVIEPTQPPGQDGAIQVTSGGRYEFGKPLTVPKVTLTLEHFGRMARLLSRNVPVSVEVNVEAQFYEDDDNAYNTIADIPGTDPQLKNQLVMLGAHLDSWQAGEGATDDGSGVTVAMEAVRLLKQLGVEPRRTIRIGLWSGEEQGLLGSLAYVKQHSGSPLENTDPKYADLPPFRRPPVSGPPHLLPEQKLVSVYFNLDYGAGKIRGVYLQDNPAVAPIFEKWMEPFHDLGMNTLATRSAFGTDHLSFDAVGIPGFQFIQDWLDYGLTHHSNMDVYEHIRPDDLKQAAVILASFVYNAAMRDEMIPRKAIRSPESEMKVDPESGADKLKPSR